MGLGAERPARDGAAELPVPRYVVDRLGRGALHVPDLHHRHSAPPGRAAALVGGGAEAAAICSGGGCPVRRVHRRGVRGAGSEAVQGESSTKCWGPPRMGLRVRRELVDSNARGPDRRGEPAVDREPARAPSGRDGAAVSGRRAA